MITSSNLLKRTSERLEFRNSLNWCNFRPKLCPRTIFFQACIKLVEKKGREIWIKNIFLNGATLEGIFLKFLIRCPFTKDCKTNSRLDDLFYATCMSILFFQHLTFDQRPRSRLMLIKEQSAKNKKSRTKIGKYSKQEHIRNNIVYYLANCDAGFLKFSNYLSLIRFTKLIKVRQI